jgi:hypothetical protein
MGKLIYWGSKVCTGVKKEKCSDWLKTNIKKKLVRLQGYQNMYSLPNLKLIVFEIFMKKFKKIETLRKIPLYRGQN